MDYIPYTKMQYFSAYLLSALEEDAYLRSSNDTYTHRQILSRRQSRELAPGEDPPFEMMAAFWALGVSGD